MDDEVDLTALLEHVAREHYGRLAPVAPGHPPWDEAPAWVKYDTKRWLLPIVRDVLSFGTREQP
jgi:hypothetical protein